MSSSPNIQQPESSPSLSKSSSSSSTSHLLQPSFKQLFIKGMDPKLCYLKSYCQLHVSNLQLLLKMKDLAKSNKDLDKKIKEVHKQNAVSKEERSSHGNEQKKKRSRRTAGEIARHYLCKYETCQKSYGSEGSLNQHIKLKHNGLPFGQ